MKTILFLLFVAGAMYAAAEAGVWIAETISQPIIIKIGGTVPA